MSIIGRQRHAPAHIVADPAGDITAWSPHAEHLFGWTTTEAVGQSLTLLMPSRLRAQHSTALHRAVTTGKSAVAGRPMVVVALHKQGHEFPAQLAVRLRHDEGGDITAIEATVTAFDGRA